jgi:hypothetical protein
MALACRLGLRKGDPPCRPDLATEQRAYTSGELADRWRRRSRD